MADISQIEVNGTVFNIEDAVAKDEVDQFTDYYVTGDAWIDPNTGLSHDHAHAVLHPSVSLYAMDGESVLGRSLNLWAGTGNLRLDNHDFSTSTITTLGYVPLSKYTTAKSYAYSTDTTLFTPASGYGVNYLRMRRWGQIVEFQLRLTHTNSISVPALGKLSSALTLGTLNNADWRPAQTAYLHSFGDNFGQAWGYMTPAGVVKLTAGEAYGTAAHTVPASTSSLPYYIDLNGMYITPMTNNY